MAIFILCIAFPLGKIYLPGSYPVIIGVTILFILASFIPGLLLGAVIMIHFTPLSFQYLSICQPSFLVDILFPFGLFQGRLSLFPKSCLLLTSLLPSLK
jgi:hypothetical protein